MMTTTYTTYKDAVQREIIEPIEAAGKDVVADAWAEFDIDAIAEATLKFDFDSGRYVPMVDANEFWRIVEKHAR